MSLQSQTKSNVMDYAKNLMSKWKFLLGFATVFAILRYNQEFINDYEFI